MWAFRCFILTFILFSLFEGAVAEENKRDDFPRFELGGQVQFQVDDGNLKSGSSRGGRPVRNGIGRFPVDTRLSPRRLRLKPTVFLSENLTLINETDLDPEDFEPESLVLTVLDMYLKYDFAEGHHLRAGQFKVPFGYEFFRSSRNITTIERSDVSRQLFQRDIGLGVFGEDGRFEYGIGLLQGQGLNEPELNGGNDVAARLVYRLTPGLRIGASGQLGSFRPDRGGPDVKVRRAGVELHYRDGPWTVEGEYLFSDGYNLFSRAATDSQGFYLYNTLRVTDPLDLVIAYDRFDPDLSTQSVGRGENAANDRDRLTLGLNYYLSREPIHRVMLNYEIRNELEGLGVRSSGWRLRYQYTW